jgi:voltage-gated potassium channel Kch
MVRQLLHAFPLMALCVIVHATGVTVAMSMARPRALWKFFERERLFIRLAAWMIVCHLVEIAMWAILYTWRGAIPDMASALYFSAVTYTTTGYGDIVLPQDWRLVGGVEALTGILMCGWSTGFFFAVVSRMHGKASDDDGATT